jgi:hypothetical protein
MVVVFVMHSICISTSNTTTHCIMSPPARSLRSPTPKTPAQIPNAPPETHIFHTREVPRHMLGTTHHFIKLHHTPQNLPCHRFTIAIFPSVGMCLCGVREWKLQRWKKREMK